MAPSLSADSRAGSLRVLPCPATRNQTAGNAAKSVGANLRSIGVPLVNVLARSGVRDLKRHPRDGRRSRFERRVDHSIHSNAYGQQDVGKALLVCRLDRQHVIESSDRLVK